MLLGHAKDVPQAVAANDERPGPRWVVADAIKFGSLGLVQRALGLHGGALDFDSWNGLFRLACARGSVAIAAEIARQGPQVRAGHADNLAIRLALSNGHVAVASYLMCYDDVTVQCLLGQRGQSGMTSS